MTGLEMSISSGPTDQVLMNETIGKCFRTTVAAYPDNPGLIVRHQSIHWTYSEYLQRVDELAAGLLALGIRPGDRVGIWAPNCYEWCLTQFATASIGAIMVCINPAYRVYELEYALNKVQCRALVTAERFKTSDYLGMLRELAPEITSSEPGALRSEKLPHLEIVVRMGEDRSPGMYNFGDVCSLGDAGHYDQLAELGQSHQVSLERDMLVQQPPEQVGVCLARQEELDAALEEAPQVALVAEGHRDVGWSVQEADAGGHPSVLDPCPDLAAAVPGGELKASVEVNGGSGGVHALELSAQRRVQATAPARDP